ncbi:hypothetical protein MMC28_009851 [Mycoblastus sanguinarius]|nr:hypothetical protein [Mycoblastus sanguinarius]
MPAFQTALAGTGLHSTSYGRSKKRKRNPATIESDSGSQETEEYSNISEPSLLVGQANPAPRSSATLEGGELDYESMDQYRTSGQPVGWDLPGKNFPHVSQHWIENAPYLRPKNKINDDLAALQPPLYVATGHNFQDATSSGAASTIGLRQSHLAAITSTLHRLIHEGDYVRAGRAWGMLLRAELNSHSLDLRTHHRWGLGADIILQRTAQLTKQGNAEDGTSAHDETEILDPGSSLCFGVEGFEKARDYYERLVLQYPYRKASPKATGPLDFYIAMFGLWIFTVQEQHSSGLANIRKRVGNIDHTKAEESDESGTASVSDIDLLYHWRREGVRKSTLQEAHRIATRLDELLVSPPYSDDARIWKLRGRVSLWVGDLLAAAQPLRVGAEHGDLVTEESSLSQGLDRRSISSDEYWQGREGREKALARAREAFDRAKLCARNPTNQHPVS